MSRNATAARYKLKGGGLSVNRGASGVVWLSDVVWRDSKLDIPIRGNMYYMGVHERLASEQHELGDDGDRREVRSGGCAAQLAMRATRRQGASGAHRAKGCSGCRSRTVRETRGSHHLSSDVCGTRRSCAAAKDAPRAARVARVRALTLNADIDAANVSVAGHSGAPAAVGGRATGREQP